MVEDGPSLLHAGRKIFQNLILHLFGNFAVQTESIDTINEGSSSSAISSPKIFSFVRQKNLLPKIVSAFQLGYSDVNYVGFVHFPLFLKDLFVPFLEHKSAFYNNINSAILIKLFVFNNKLLPMTKVYFGEVANELFDGFVASKNRAQELELRHQKGSFFLLHFLELNLYFLETFLNDDQKITIFHGNYGGCPGLVFDQGLFSKQRLSLQFEHATAIILTKCTEIVVKLNPHFVPEALFSKVFAK